MGDGADGTRRQTDSAGSVGDWLIVGTISLVLLAGPGVLLVITPRRPATLAGYLVLALLTALAFGAIGVWTALRHGPGD